MKTKRRSLDPPPDATWCIRCRKIIGDFHGWFGGQCFCEQPTGSAIKGAHSISALRKR